MTHTAGPWRVSADGIWARSPWNAQVKIAAVTICSPMNGIDWKSNAALIGAAPALLAALQGMVDMYVALVNSGDAGFWNPETVDEVKAARAAIQMTTCQRPRED